MVYKDVWVVGFICFFFRINFFFGLIFYFKISYWSYYIFIVLVKCDFMNYRDFK